MQTENALSFCANLPSPLLTVYLNRVEPDQARHPQRRTDLAWLEKAAAEAIRKLPYRDAKQLHRQVDRVAEFLQKHRPEEKAIVFFAGPHTWKTIPLESPVKDDLAWGKPKIEQLLPLLQGHRNYGVVVLDHKGVRYFAHTQAGFRLLAKSDFEVDPSQWKRQVHSSISSEGMQKSRGPQRDLYASRLAAQYDRLCGRSAKEIEKLASRYELAGVFLVGPDRLLDALQSKLPGRLAETTVLIREDLGRSSAKAVERLVLPAIESYQAERQLAEVNRLLEATGNGLTNPDEVLSELQDGRIHTVIVAEGLQLSLRKCPKCGLASSSADRDCPECGTRRQITTLDELLPEVLEGKHTKIEFVSGPAAELLLKTGGLGGWLRSMSVAAAS